MNRQTKFYLELINREKQLEIAEKKELKLLCYYDDLSNYEMVDTCMYKLKEIKAKKKELNSIIKLYKKN